MKFYLEAMLNVVCSNFFNIYMYFFNCCKHHELSECPCSAQLQYIQLSAVH